MISSKLDSAVTAGGGKAILDQMASNDIRRSTTPMTTKETTDTISNDEMSNLEQLDDNEQEDQKQRLAGLDKDHEQLTTTTVMELEKLSRSAILTTPKPSNIDSSQRTTNNINDNNNSNNDNNDCGVNTSTGGQPVKSSKNLPTSTTQIKKKRKIEETIIDGFAISAFRTWEDLQDELNERIATAQISNNTNVTADKSASKKKSTSSKKPSKSKQHPTTATTTTTSSSTSADDDTNSQLQSNSSAGKVKKKEKKDKPKPRLIENDPSSGSSTNSTESQQQEQQQSISTSNKSNKSEKATLKRALEAKELAEKRLSLLQQKLEQDDDDFRGQTNNDAANSGSSRNGSTSQDPHLRPQQPLQMSRDNHPPSESAQQHQQYHHKRPNNGILAQDLLKDPTIPPQGPPKYAPYPSYGMNSPYMMPLGQQPSHMMHQPGPLSDHSYQNGSPSTKTNPHASSMHNQQTFDHKHHPASEAQRFLQGQSQHRHHQSPSTPHQPPPPPPPPTQPLPSFGSQTQFQNSHPAQASPSRPAFNPNFFNNQGQTPNYHHQMPSHYQMPPSHLPPQQQQQQHHHHQTSVPSSPIVPPPPFGYPPHHLQTNPMAASMSMGAMPSPYSPYIITDTTISRQTSIIPSAMDHVSSAAAAAAASRYGHHASMLHSMNPYSSSANAAATAAAAAAAVASASQTHHTSSMYYPPPLSTERSFMEFARNYTGPNHHLNNYPSLMHSLPLQSSPAQPSSSSSSTAAAANGSGAAGGPTAIPYGLGYRAAFDHHQRAVSRYNSLYNASNTGVPDRTSYANYQAAPTTARPPPFPTGLFPPPF